MWYHLKGQGKTEEDFYQCSKNLSVLFEEKIEQNYRCLVRGFLDYIHRDDIGKNRKDWYVPNEIEAALELVLLGVTYRWYFSSGQKGLPETVQYRDIRMMISQLETSGEFTEEILRWNVWMAYFVSMEQEEWKCLWEKIFDVLLWLEKEGGRQLQQFLTMREKKRGEYRLPEQAKGDDYLLYRDALFYYINMLGAQVLNRCYCKTFGRAKQYYIFLPGCMTASEKCQAKKKKDGYACEACHKECMVNIITQQYKEAGVKVRILYHESEMNSHYVQPEDNIGVIGVSCVLNLLSGGFKARRLGYIPQCVILNYPGCRQHWEKQGRIVTTLYLDELKNLLTAKEETYGSI